MNEASKSKVEQISEIGWIKDIIHQALLVWRLLKDPDVPIYLKLLPLLTVIYVIWPVDIVPDVIPFFGQLDDASALVLGAKLFVELSPQEIVDYYLQQLKGQYVAVRGPDEERERIVIDEDDLD